MVKRVEHPTVEEHKAQGKARIVLTPERYADQNHRDHAAFCDAIRSGRLQAIEGA